MTMEQVFLYQKRLMQRYEAMNPEGEVSVAGAGGERAAEMKAHVNTEEFLARYAGQVREVGAGQVREVGAGQN